MVHGRSGAQLCNVLEWSDRSSASGSLELLMKGLQFPAQILGLFQLIVTCPSTQAPRRVPPKKLKEGLCSVKIIIRDRGEGGLSVYRTFR